MVVNTNLDGSFFAEFFHDSVLRMWAEDLWGRACDMAKVKVSFRTMTHYVTGVKISETDMAFCEKALPRFYELLKSSLKQRMQRKYYRRQREHDQPRDHEWCRYVAKATSRLPSLDEIENPEERPAYQAD
jgi:hypothetical protein